MHIRVFDLAAERCVWSIPPIDTVPLKLLGDKLIVRCFDAADRVTDVAVISGAELKAWVMQGSPHIRRITLHCADNDSYTGRVTFLPTSDEEPTADPTQNKRASADLREKFDTLANDRCRSANLANDAAAPTGNPEVPGERAARRGPDRRHAFSLAHF